MLPLPPAGGPAHRAGTAGRTGRRPLVVREENIRFECGKKTTLAFFTLQPKQAATV